MICFKARNKRLDLKLEPTRQALIGQNIVTINKNIKLWTILIT